jgi:hypothetical protein
MKQVALVFIFSMLASFAYARALDKECYKRCLEKIDDKKKCEEICKT